MPRLARLTRAQEFRTSLAGATGADRKQTIILAIPDDSMGYVFDRLRDAGGAGALALVRGDEVAGIAFLWPAAPARMSVADEDDGLAQIHRESSVEMFFDYLEGVRATVVHRVAAQLVDQRDLQPT